MRGEAGIYCRKYQQAMRRKAEPCLNLLRSYLRRCSSHQLQNHPSLRSFGSLRTLPYFPLFQPSHHENRDPSQTLTHSKSYYSKFGSFVQLLSPHSPVAGSSERFVLLGLVTLDSLHCHHYHRYSSHRNFFTRAKQVKKINTADEHSQRAVTTALWCNFLVFSLKFGVWLSTSSHVMLAEVVHSVADFANQLWLFQGKICLVFDICCWYLLSWFWSYNCSWLSKLMDFTGASLIVAIQAVKKGAAAEGMKVRDYIWRGHDPTSVAVMTEDGAAVTGLAIAGASLIAVNTTGNAIYDPIGSIIVGNLLGMVAIFLIQRNRHALIGRAIDDNDMEKVLHFLKNDPVVDALYDCKSEVIGPGFFRFKAEIDFNGVKVVQNYIDRTGRVEWARQFREAAKGKDDTALLKIMSNYGEEVVTALGSEVDRLEKEIQELVPGIRHVDIEAHNPTGPSP